VSVGAREKESLFVLKIYSLKKQTEKMITRKKVFVILILTLLNVEYGMSKAIENVLDFQDCGKRL